MSIDSRVSIFTQSLKTQFVNAFAATAEPAEWEKFTEIVPSGGRIETYPWLSPSPGINRYAGHRRYGKIDVLNYRVENVEWDAAFTVLLRDIQDEQIAGYSKKPVELSARAKLFPGKAVLKNMALGKTLNCFDGGPFFANTHPIGTINNLISYTSSSNSDGHTFVLVALFTGGPLKPLIWQNRKGPDFETNAGSTQSKEAKQVNYWIDMEGAAAFSYPYDAIWVDITNTPTVAEMQEIYKKIGTAFRGFQLAKALASDDGEYIHEQTKFSSGNLFLVGSPSLENLLRQSLTESWIPQQIGSNTVATTNLFNGWASYTITNFLTES